MKRREIQNRLKNEAEQNTPQVYDRIVASAQAEGLLKNTDERYAVNNRANTASIVKSRRIGLAAAFVAVIACIAILISLLPKKSTGIPSIPSPITLSTNDVYGMGAVSTVRLLGSETSARAIQSFSAAARAVDNNAETAATAEDDVKAQVQKFNEYFTALDSFLGDDVVSTVTEANADPNYNYENKLTINGKNFNGENVQYVMYFSETLHSTETDEDEGEVESVYVLEGVMVIDGQDYYLEGERSLEQESDETEHELKIRAYADLADRGTYVQMEQEYAVENGETETEYVYSIYANGVLTEQTAVEFEAEKKGGKEEAEYELEFRQGDAKGRYSVKREVKENKTEIKVKYDVGGKHDEFKITLTAENKYEYVFNDGSTLSF